MWMRDSSRVGPAAPSMRRSSPQVWRLLLGLLLSGATLFFMRRTMPLGIRPTVDFAFKKIFGSPEYSTALIGLLNAVLDFPEPIVEVEILNPFNYQEFADKKQVVLDLKARDSSGRWLNVEMQVSAYGGLLERLIFYACSMFVDQLEAGNNYAQLQPAITICLLRVPVFADTRQAHHRFQMIDRESDRELEKGIEVHTVELTKYNLDASTISNGSAIEQWAFFFLHSHEYESSKLQAMLPALGDTDAIDVAQLIFEKTEDKAMYDQREKELRDHEWVITGAREEGKEEGREEGKEEGKEEGELIGCIKTYQNLMGLEVAEDELAKLSIEELKLNLEVLKQKFQATRQ